MAKIFIWIFVFILIIIFIKIFSSPSKNRSKSIKDHPIPENLGIQIEGGFPMVQSLEKALLNTYVENVKIRVLKEQPEWTNYEVNWLFFELKRYFIITGILKSVPMFSTQVDVIWHEMLMFTKEYGKFSKDFYHEILHHTPNLDKKPIPGERAFFDWVYLSLFESYPNNRVIWKGFLQNPIKREILDDFRTLSEAELLAKYFRKNEDWLEVKRTIINNMKKEIMEADQIKMGKRKLDAPRATTETQYYNLALGAAVYFSIYEEDEFQDYMSELFPMEFYKSTSYGSGSPYYGSGCSASYEDDHNSGGDSDGDSSGGSSCSSCSSCGGGCSS